MTFFRLVTVSAVAASRQLAAETSCPCLTERPATAPASLTITYVDNSGTSSTHTFPASYGLSECSAWDTNEAPHCLEANPPGWCTASWCYVGDDCTGTITSWDVEYGAGVADAWFPASGLRRSYATCGAANYLARASTIDIGTLTADALITLVDNYLFAVRDSVEKTLKDINANTIDVPSRRCDAPVDNCACANCAPSAWNASHAADFHHVGYSTQDMSLLALDQFDEGNSCAVRGQIESHFQALGQQVYNDAARVGELRYTWANAHNGLTMQYPAQTTCPNKRDFRFASTFSMATAGPRDVMVILSGSIEMKHRWARVLRMVKHLLNSLTEFDFIGFVMYGRFGNAITISYEPTEQGLADGLSPGKFVRRATRAVREDIYRWIISVRPDEKSLQGSERWHDGFEAVSEIMEISRANQMSSFCQTPILLLPGSMDQSRATGYYYQELFAHLQPQPMLFVYAMYPSEKQKPEEWEESAHGNAIRNIVCEKNADDEIGGIFVPFPDSHDISDYIMRYSAVLAEGTENRDNVRYTKRVHEGTGKEVITACLPAYEERRFTPREVAGVACVDVDFFVPLDDLKNNVSSTFDYAEFTQKFIAKSAQCESFKWRPLITNSINVQCVKPFPTMVLYIGIPISSILFIFSWYMCYKKKEEIKYAIRTSRSARMLSTMGSRALGSRSLSGSQSPKKSRDTTLDVAQGDV